MDNFWQHLMIMPIVIPLFTGAFLLVWNNHFTDFKWLISLISIIVQTVISVILFIHVLKSTDHILLYDLGQTARPFAITLVCDLLSGFFLILFSIIFADTLFYASAYWHKIGYYFYSLVQSLILGVNGCLLTGDIFNLFVFFEIMLAASYGLAFYGGAQKHLKLITQYLVINFVCSSFLLLAIAILYAITGTLNIAYIAEKIHGLNGKNLVFYEISLVLLGVTFFTKAGAWPFGFWLPKFYSSKVYPVSAFFVVLSKVAIYAMLRIGFLFLPKSPEFIQHMVLQITFASGTMTVFWGMLGVLAERSLTKITASCALISSGTLMMLIGYGRMGIMIGVLFYFASSALALSALFIISELVNRRLKYVPKVLKNAFPQLQRKKRNSPLKETSQLITVSFILFVILLIGLPPLSGFIAKVMTFSNVFSELYIEKNEITLSFKSLFLLAVVFLSGITSFIAFTRYGIRVFWNFKNSNIIQLHRMERVSVLVLLGTCLFMTIGFHFCFCSIKSIQEQLENSAYYIEKVLDKNTWITINRHNG